MQKTQKQDGNEQYEAYIKPLSLRNKEDRFVLAIHEAGHAVGAFATGGFVGKPGIVLEEDRGRTCTLHPTLRRRDRSNAWRYHEGVLNQMYRASIVTGFAGPIAQYRATGRLAHVDGDARGIVSDLRGLFRKKDKLLECCNYEKYGIQFVGMVLVLTGESATIGKAFMALDVVDGRELIDAAIVRLLVRLAKCGHRVVGQNWPAVEEIAGRLMKRTKMGGEEIERIALRHGITSRDLLMNRRKLFDDPNKIEGLMNLDVPPTRVWLGDGRAAENN